jgi:hypothetical protein
VFSDIECLLFWLIDPAYQKPPPEARVLVTI